MKRMLCLSLAVIFVVGICFSAPVTITASAAFTLESGDENTVGAVYNDSESGLKFRILDLENKYVEVCGYNTAPTNLEIPATVTINETTYSVTTIGMGALDGCNKLTTITIPQSVTSIGSRAFVNCESLTSVVIPDSVVSLGEMAFYTCGGLETVTLSNNITVIPDDAFAYCHSLKTLPITENITSIGECAFYDSGEHSKVSLSGVTIGSEAFRSCGITELTLENCDLNDTDIFTNNDIEELVLSNTDIPDEMFDGHAYIKTLVAEDSVLGSSSFAYCSELKSVTVSGGEINNDAFSNCSLLETVTIDNIESVGEYAFNNCPALKTVEVNATEISEYAFSMCTSLENVKLGDGVEVIGDAAFESCTSLAELELPETVTKIGKWVFNGCNLLTELVIPKSVTTIHTELTAGCFNLKYIFFVGTEAEQKTIGDALVTNAKIHYGSATHTFNENYTVDLEPTCTEKGSESQHCKFCDLTQNERPVKELGHTAVNGCTEEAHIICDVCEEILSTKHEFTSKITTDPTCTKEGVKTFTCECGYTYTAVVPATGHTEVTVTGKAATCTETGLTDGKKCSVCGTVTKAQETIKAKGHKTTVINKKDATCTIDGYTGDTYCSECKTTTVKGSVIKAKGHTEVIIPAVKPTLTTVGKTEGKKCSVCNTILVKQKDIAKLTLTTPSAKTQNAAKGVLITWNAVENAEKYIVYQRTYNTSTKKYSNWKSIKTTTDLKYVDTTVKLGTTYSYAVKAVNGSVTSKYTATSNKKYDVTPAVKVAVVSNGVKVSWTTAANATGYIVYRAELSNGKWSNWKNMGTKKSTSTNWTDKTVKSGTQYKYTVRAVYGSIRSNYKASANILYLTQPTVKIMNNETGIKVSWNKVTGSKGYTVYRQEFTNGKWTNWKNMGTIKNGSVTSWVDKSVKSGITYCYTVRAINGNYRSSYKATDSLIFLSQPKVTVKSVSNGISVNWTQSVGARGYIVYRSELVDGKWSNWANMGIIEADKESWTDKSAEKGKSYKYTVRAVHSGIRSSYKASNLITK